MTALSTLARHRRPPSPPVTRLAVFAALLGAWELAASTGQLDPLTAPSPIEVLGHLDNVVLSDEFLEHLRRTAFEVIVTFLLGLGTGLTLGFTFWRSRAAGDAVEPYLVTMYAMPTLVFYPILLALMGLNAGPIIAIAAVFATVPVAVSTMIALRSIEPTLVKLAASLSMTTSQRYRTIIVPAATPLAFPGMKLGFIYSVVGTIAMEFILASRGLGYMIGFSYESYEIVTMYGYITVVVVLAVIVNSSLTLAERKIRKDML